ncbi:MAG: hypothetical protein IT546_11115, partial [Caulobacteraceae bacterium]|nr:hypothetical protein [Caulobacteraceae bacterium]
MASTAIALPPLALETVEVPLIGISPLIVHAWSEKALRAMADKQQKRATKGREAKNPRADFIGSLYPLTPLSDEPSDNELAAAKFGFPAVAFKSAAVDACTSIAGLTKVAARQAFHLLGEMVEIIGPPPAMREDVCRVGMGVADLRYRGQFEPWGVRLRVQINTAVLSAEQCVTLFNLAGFAVGVGEWR